MKENCAKFLRVVAALSIGEVRSYSLLTNLLLFMNRFKDYFYYTKKERWAILLLSVLLLSTLLWSLAPLKYNNTPATALYWEAALHDFEQHQTGFPNPKKSYQKESSKLYASADPFYKKKEFDQQRRSASVRLQPQPFDPNTVSASALEAMQLPQRSIKSIVNYRSKGGQFKTKEDLKRMYTLSAAHYEALEPYIQLPSKTSATFAHISSRPLPPAFEFDPNTSSAETFAALGLSPKTIQSILNYRNKGGQFRRPQDFKKIYTLPDSVYQHLAPFITLAKNPKQQTTAYKKRSYRTIDVNSAQAVDFEQFRGIGASYARRLVEWRERLGGFTSVEQVGELYRLPDSTFQQMRPHLRCAQTPVVQININTATVEELKAHPYLRWAQAKAIVYYREKRGRWESVDMLQILSELDDGKNTFERVRPYLTH